MAVTVKLHDFVESISQSLGDFALRQNPLRGNSEQSTPRIKGSQRNGEELTFQTRSQTFNDPGLLQKLNLSFKCVFLFQQLANMGGIWKQGWKKKRFGPPQEFPADRPDRRLSEAKAHFIYRVRLM